jgi:alkaline phosphatase
MLKSYTICHELITSMSATTTSSRLLALLLIVSFLSVPSVPITHVQWVNDSIPAADGPLSIILMIGDGMGYEHVELARLVEVGEFGSLFMQDSDWNASMTTYAANAAVTDSAASGTAIATGTKTNTHYVGVDPSFAPLETILEYAQTLNKSTGVVSTCQIVDATPASFMTHVNDRSYFDQIAQQIVDSDVDVLLGGGLDYFNSTQISSMTTNGYSLVYNLAELSTVTTGRVFGLFADKHMNYEFDRNYTLQPSIAEMTNKSIEILSQDNDGFFLMVEGGRIDLAAHDLDKVRNALDTIAFDKAVEVAIDYVKDHNNTILIVTADHETMGLVVMSHNLNSELPADLVSETDRRTLRAERANNVTVDWTATYHTDWPVPLFAFGTPFSDLKDNIFIDNTDIYTLMKDFYLGNSLNVTELPPTTTEPTVTTTTDLTVPTNPPEFPLAAPLILAASAGIAIIVLVAVLRAKQR